MKKVRPLLFIIAILVVLFIKGTPFYLRHKLAKELIENEEKMNKSLPVAVSETCSLIKIKPGPELHIEYVYKFTDKDADTMSSTFIEEFDSLTYSSAIEKFIQNKKLRLFRKYGGEILLTSQDSKSKTFSQVPIKFEMMKSHASWNLKEHFSK